MKKLLISSIAALFVLTIIVVAQKPKQTPFDYDKQWQKVNKLLDEEQLPESAQKELELILQQSNTDKNIVQQIKATIYSMRLSLLKDQDKASDIIADFENFISKVNDPADKALLYSMNAELYVQYYNSERWTIDRRTEVKGIIPEDIKEWTKNIFRNKIVELFEKSLQNQAVLQKTKLDKYQPLMEYSENKMLELTLFDFLANRSIDLLKSLGASENEWPADLMVPAQQFVILNPDLLLKDETEILIAKTYQALLNYHQSDAQPIAFINNDLSRLEYANGQNQHADQYLKSLDYLAQRYAESEYVIEVLDRQVNYYLAHSAENAIYKRKAYEICETGIKRFPNYARINLLKNSLNQITAKNIIVNNEQTAASYTEIKLNINCTNVSDLQIDVYRVNATPQEYFKFRRDYQNRELPYADRTFQKSYEFKVQTNPNFGQVDTTYNLPTGDYGIYEVSVKDKALKSSVTNFTVTDLTFIARGVKELLSSIYVLNRTTGFPQKDVSVNAFQYKWNGREYNLSQNQSLSTDKNGFMFFPFTQNSGENILFLAKGNDKYFVAPLQAYYYGTYNTPKHDLKISLFTDRSLYRPGQRLYFKGIAYYADKERNETAVKENVEVTLFDVNHQKVSSKSFSSNAFGSFAGEFVLPTGGLNGAFTLRAGNTVKTFYVEEYKRPTFEVVLDKPENEIRFGEPVHIQGDVKAYAGYQVGGAKVKYRITRASHRYCWWWNEPEQEISNGSVEADANGRFSVQFVPQKGANSHFGWRGTYYTYMIYTDVTDQKGETQTAEQTVSVGEKSLFIVPSVPEKVEKSTGISFGIYAETLNGKQLTTDIQYSIYKLEESVDYLENIKNADQQKNQQKVASGTYNTVSKKLNLNVSKWESGRYRLVLTTLDKWGNEVKTENLFTVYGQNDKRPPVKCYEWFEAVKTQCSVGEDAVIRFGTSAPNAMVLYEVMKGNKTIEKKWIKLSNKILNFKIPFKEDYGAGVNVLFTFMKDGKFFSRTIAIERKREVKKITPVLSVFRNKLLPGEKAEWTITIPELKMLNKPAEILAGMYDASLDAIRPHSWSFDPVYSEPVEYSPAWLKSFDGISSSFVYTDVQTQEAPEWTDYALNWFGLEMGNRYNRPIRIRGMKSIQEDDNVVLNMVEDVESVVTVGYGTMKSKEPLADSASFAGSEKPVQEPKIRTNFNETAFFYPQLKTDAQGQVKFSFTAPESLTRWNVKMLAHTSDLYSGMFDTTAVTQKDVMVQMNLPRFVRRSDKLVLSANVINLTDQNISAQVKLELIDPAIDKPIVSGNLLPQTVSLGAKETKPVNWEVSGFAPYDLVVAKVLAQSGNFSDGEQKYLPVLPDKVLITETQPLIIRANQTREFNFGSFIKNVSNVETKNLTVEFSSNPAWYAVQALPALSTPDTDNALSLFTAYYVNSLAGYIVRSNPKVAGVFEQWKNAVGGRDALLSNLEKNQELKNMLLEETPWVMAAKDETEQKRRIALLFDLNMQKNQAQQLWDKLLKLRLSNGAFTWFAGMSESRYITQEILLNAARLQRLTKETVSQDIFAPSVDYIDRQIAKDFADLKKYNKDYQKQNCVGNMQLFYLHVRSEYPQIPVPEYAQEAVKFYTAQSEKYWTTFSLYGKAMMAIVAHRNGKTAIAQSILKSLKENALKTDEFGMCWPRNTAGYFWNERPVAVQAALIEAFAEISPQTSDVDEMKIWLLKQKQTQCWDSPVSTVNAVYALLLQGNDWLSGENKVTIKTGDRLITPAIVEAGTGYFKETIPANEINALTGKITVSSANSKIKNSSIGWGAMYWQYYQEPQNVKNSSSGLKITKQLFVKTGNSMLPIEKTALKTGDRVVTRLVVSSDRNMDYVALKDVRAACFEPVDQRSGCEWKEGVCYYQTTKDASTQFFFSHLPKGNYVLEYEVWVNNAGDFTSGIASVQCQYAPEFVGCAGGEKITVGRP